MLPELLEYLLALFLALSTLAQCAVWGIGLGIFNRKQNIADANFVAPSATGTMPAITVVVCARNEAHNLRHHLPPLLHQRCPYPYEVLVVDDASEDDTPDLLRALAAEYPLLRTERIAIKEHGGKKQALARGVELSRGDWIALTDADCLPASDRWLEHLCAPLHRGADMALGHGPLMEAPGFLNQWSRYEVTLTALQYYAFLYFGAPYMGVGRNMAWRKSVFTQSGGFGAHAHITSGDDDLFVNANAHRLRVEAVLHPDSFTYSEAKNTWASYYRQKNRHLSTGKFYRPGHRFWLGCAAMSHSLHYLFLALLVLAQFSTVFVLSFYVIRLLTVILVCRPAFRTLGEKKLVAWLPVFDFLLPVFYVVFIPSIFLHKNNRPRSWT